MTKKPRVMGLDLSLTSTGIVVAGKRVLYSTLVNPPGPQKAQMEARIKTVNAAVFNLFQSYKPDLVVIENYAYHSVGRAVTILGELHGVVRQTLFRKQAPFTVVPPTEIKYFACQKGNATKDQMIEAACAEWPELSEKPRKGQNDLADAYWLARWGQANYLDIVVNV